MVHERAAAVKRVMGNRFPNVPSDQVERLVDREQTIVPKVFGDFTSRTLLNELENSGINLDYKPTEDSPSLSELVDTTINDTLVTVRDRVDRPMTSISSVSDGANILTGLNGLTADNMTVFSLLVEQRLGAENVSSEAIYDFVRELQKEATQPSNQERLVSPLGVLVYHDDRRNMSIQLASNIADKDYGKSFVQPTSERLAAYRRNERQRGFMRKHLNNIAPYHFGEVDRDWVSVHGYPQATTTLNNSAYQQMIDEYTNPAAPFDIQGGYGAD